MIHPRRLRAVTQIQADIKKAAIKEANKKRLKGVARKEFFETVRSWAFTHMIDPGEIEG